MVQMSHLLALTTMAMEHKYQDFLGAMFMELELGNKWRGQFFTPYNLCKVIAELTYSPEQYKGGVVTLDEPAVGAGAMVIAKCEVLEERGVNFQHKLRVVAQDVDWMTFCMAYIQLSLIGCQAHVIHGNSLSLEAKDVWCTPMAMMHGWFV